MDLSLKVEHTIQRSGLLDHYENDKVEKSADKLENLKELVTAASNFNGNELSEFLDHSILESNDSEGESDYIQLMTLHSSKGLEFPVVFLVGLEEGLFPSNMAGSEKGMEEERRLMYVGITRAMKKLFITSSTKRMVFGRIQYMKPSRFLTELPSDLLHIFGEPVTPMKTIERKFTSTIQESKYKKGDTVNHVSFGKGVVLDTKGSGENESVFIRFSSTTKWLMSNYIS